MRLKVSNVCQLLPIFTRTVTNRGVTFTYSGDGSCTINGTPTGEYYSASTIALDTKSIKPNHKYLIYDINNEPIISELIIADYQGGYFFKLANEIFTFPEHDYTQFIFEIRVNLNQTANNIVVKPQFFDLTEMYGIGNEPTTVAQFRQDFPNEMYEYSPVCWKKFSRLKYVMETKNLLNITPSMCKHCTYKDGILKANVVNFYYAVLNVTDLFEIGNTYTVSWSIIHKKSLSQTASVVVYGKSKTDPDKTVFREYRSAITGNNYTFTINDEDFSSISFVELRFFRYNTITTDTESSILNIQVELGSTPTPYQPYGYLPLNRGKYIANKEPVQLLDKSKYPATQTINGVTFTNNGDGTITVNGTATNNAYFNIQNDQFVCTPNKKYLLCGCPAIGSWTTFALYVSQASDKWLADVPDFGNGNVFTGVVDATRFSGVIIFIVKNQTVNNLVFKPQLYDLTEMYGIGNEPTTVEQFRADFPNELYDYNPYNAITFR